MRPTRGGLLLSAAACLAPAHAFTKTLYVSAATGVNFGPGTSVKAPLATIQYAEGLTNPGDTVMVMNGTYTNPAPGSDILLIDRSGTAAAPITYQAYPGQHPVLRYTNAWAAIAVMANYIVLNGFEVVGNAASISKSYGLAQARNLMNPLTNGDGIDVLLPPNNATPNHITIENMVVHDVPGGGIGVEYADYIYILNNTVYNTSNWSPYGDSAISVYEPHDVDKTSGYKIQILHNTTFNNSELVPCACRNFQAVSDGNGIIIDDNLGTQGNNVRYGGRTLIAYNVSFENGGSGIHAYSSQHVDILNNTAYGNDLIATPTEGQIFSDSGADVKIIDNILDSPARTVITSSNNNATTVTEDYNVLWNAAGALMPPPVPGSHDILANPLFISPSAGNFGLMPASPALGSAPPLATRSATLPAASSLVTSANRGAK